MLNHEENPHLPTAADARVSARDLTEALASIEVRNARQAYDQAGTLTLTEAVAECSVEATPEELQPEIDRIRAAEAMQRKAKRRQRFLRIGLGTEVVSAAFCLLVLLGLKQTQFNPTWQQVRQAESFQQKLSQTVGPHPQYEIFVVPQSGSFSNGSQTTVMTFGDWANHPAYPLYSIPDGYDVYHFDGLNDEEHDAMTPPFMQSSPVYVEFREPQVPWFRDNISVYYEGHRYWRGMIRKQDIPNLLHGHAFTLYPALVASPQYKIADIVPITVSVHSIEEANGQWGQASPECYDLVRFGGGLHLRLDEHAWEQYPGTQ